MYWHKLRREHGRWVLGSTNLKEPAPKGVCVRQLPTPEPNVDFQTQDMWDGQRTLNEIAKDGVVVHRITCYNGMQRDLAIKKAIELAEMR